MIAILTTFFLMMYPIVRADVKITYHVKNYVNRDNLDYRLRKCEAFHFLGDHCDPIFQFTAYTTNTRGERVVSVKKEVGPFSNKRVIDSVLVTSHILQKFPHIIEFELDISDNDADADELIAQFTRKVAITKTGEIKLNLGADVRVVVLIQIECADNYHGERCEVYCRPYSGLWTCHEVTGARVCAKPCVHGSCVLTSTSAVCVCASGWKGEFCKIPADSRLITSALLPDLPQGEVQPSSEPEVFANHYLPPASHAILSTPSSVTVGWSTSASILKEVEPQVQSRTSEVDVQGSNQTELEEDLSKVARNNTPRLMVQTSWDNHSDERKVPLDEERYNMINATTISWNENDTVVKHAGGHTTNASSVHMIMLTIVSVVIIWAIVLVIAAVVFYRWRNAKKGSGHSRSPWTKVSYNLNPIVSQQSTLSWTRHKHDNAIIQPGSLRILSNRSSNYSGPHVSLLSPHSAESDGSEANRYAASPFTTGSHTRFVPPKADPLPPAPTDIPCMKVNDSYDELTDLGEDYATLESDTSPKTPLTSFQRL